MIGYSELPGATSSRALSEHLKLFDGYIKMLEKADLELKSIHSLNKNALDGNIAKSLRNHGYAVGGADLHSLYFSNLSLEPKPPESAFVEHVLEHWGSLDNLYEQMKSTGLSCRGWAVLAQDPGSKNLRIFAMNSHDEGAAFGYNPLCVIDVWEHAYWMDWGTDKNGYLTALKPYIDWGMVSSRFS